MSATEEREPRRRYYVTHVKTYGGAMEWQCEPGQLDKPVGCERHSDHHWCKTCDGYYGVPHTGIHEGRDAHPNQFAGDFRQCACRPCKTRSGRE